MVDNVDQQLMVDGQGWIVLDQDGWWLMMGVRWNWWTMVLSVDINQLKRDYWYIMLVLTKVVNWALDMVLGMDSDEPWPVVRQWLMMTESRWIWHCREYSKSKQKRASPTTRQSPSRASRVFHTRNPLKLAFRSGLIQIGANPKCPKKLVVM